MRILITGDKGLLGSACVRVLRDSHEVLIQPRIDYRNRSLVYWLFNSLRPDAVIHCAAKVGGVKANRDDPVSFIEDNIAINSNVIGAAHLFGVKKLVNIGTSCLYPKDAVLPVKESSLMTGPFEPDVAAYATAKLMAYVTCNSYRSQYGDNFVTACPANLYGLGDNYGPSAHVIPALIARAYRAKKEGAPLIVWGDGSAVREFLHAEDAATAIQAVLEKWNSPELINIGSGRGTTIKELAELVAERIGVSKIEWDTTQPVGISRKTFDISRIKSLGWNPCIPLKDGIFSTCSDYINAPNRREK
jgi:GDP-L-fucose synthase